MILLIIAAVLWSACMVSLGVRWGVKRGREAERFDRDFERAGGLERKP